jgi:hypothetical protein
MSVKTLSTWDILSRKQGTRRKKDLEEVLKIDFIIYNFSTLLCPF